MEGLHHIRCDITDEDQVRSAVAEIMDRAGRIDILVNNAGFGISGAVEFTDTAEAKRQLDVNFFGMVNMNKAVVPTDAPGGPGKDCEPELCGRALPIPFQAYYSASKAAVNAYTMALANELRPFGITVCAVLPRGYPHRLYRRPAKKTMGGETCTAAASAGPSSGWSTTSRTAWTPPRPGRLLPGGHEAAAQAPLHHPL